MTASAELEWALDDITMRGTLTVPDGPGPFPTVVMVAGSGPTDRDWTSPLLPGGNGSARLLAEVLAEAGYASLRYDKRASGPDLAQNVTALMGRISMQSHLDELVAAVASAAAQEAVDATKLVGLGNSEGCLHVLHYATTVQPFPFVGVVLTAPPGRAIGELFLAQLTQQLSAQDGGEAMLELVEAAVARYEAGQAMDPDPSLPEPVMMALASFDTPMNLPFARELWAEDAADTLPEVTLPTIVVIGRRDLQVDATIDGPRLQEAAAGMSNVGFAFPENANHILKHEERSIAEVVASGDLRYASPDTHLDPEAVGMITSWLREVVG